MLHSILHSNQHFGPFLDPLLSHPQDPIIQSKIFLKIGKEFLSSLHLLFLLSFSHQLHLLPSHQLMKRNTRNLKSFFYIVIIAQLLRRLLLANIITFEWLG